MVDHGQNHGKSNFVPWTYILYVLFAQGTRQLSKHGCRGHSTQSVHSVCMYIEEGQTHQQYSVKVPYSFKMYENCRNKYPVLLIATSNSRFLPLQLEPRCMHSSACQEHRPSGVIVVSEAPSFSFPLPLSNCYTSTTPSSASQSSYLSTILSIKSYLLLSSRYSHLFVSTVPADLSISPGGTFQAPPWISRTYLPLSPSLGA